MSNDEKMRDENAYWRARRMKLSQSNRDSNICQAFYLRFYNVRYMNFSLYKYQRCIQMFFVTLITGRIDATHFSVLISLPLENAVSQKAATVKRSVSLSTLCISIFDKRTHLRGI